MLQLSCILRRCFRGAGCSGGSFDTEVELALGKNADAAKKLTDFRIKVEQLNAGGKIDPDYAATLISDANAAITCIESIS